MFTVLIRFNQISPDQQTDLDVEQEVHHVAIFNDIVFTF